uniref:Uncharacterized protein n=1 Tax=Mycena chlorophos TaxID=658473 RepID=A0ABQ0M6L7_MYCCL|nr:predicted protein [Mycena chlorophos]
MSSPPPSSSPVPASSVRRSTRPKAVSSPAQPSSPKRKGLNQETGSRKILRSDANASPGTSAAHAIPTSHSPRRKGAPTTNDRRRSDRSPSSNTRAGTPVSSSAPCGLEGEGTTPSLSEIVDFIVTRFLPSAYPDIFGEGSNMSDTAAICTKMLADVSRHFQRSVAFTDVLPIFDDFTEESEDIPIFSPKSRPASGPPPTVDELKLRGTHGAFAECLRDHQSFVTTDALLASPMWQVPRSHTLHSNEAAARISIDTVMQHSMDVGQRLLASVEKLDEDICHRYGFNITKKT